MPKALTRLPKTATSSQNELDPQEKEKVATKLVITDKATKRVIAPFVRIVRKDIKYQEVEEAKHFSFYLQKKPSVLIRDLSSFLSDSVDLPSLLHETSDVLRNVTRASGASLYMIDTATNEIYLSQKTPVNDRFKIKWKIKPRSTVAAYVAYKKDYVMVDDILEDDRFPEGVGYETNQVKSVLCIPVVTPGGECFAVIELYRLLFDSPFSKDDLKITLIVTGWMGAAVHQNANRLALKRQQELNDYLLDLIKCYIGESVVLEKLVSEILKFAKVTLNAERGTMFIIDRDSGDDMVADLFDEAADEDKEGPPVYKKAQKVRFAKDRGIAGLVARTGITVNVKDAYKDARFNKEVDQRTGFITRSILCMPIMGGDDILGVVQVVNKKSGGSFSTTDENLFKTFCVYCSLAIRYTKVQNQLNATKRLNNCFLKMVQLQMKPCIHDIMHHIHHNTQVPIPEGFNQFTWYINNEDHSKMPQYCLYMFLQIINSHEIEVENTMQYILSIRKFYRRNPFHNFEHAFNVCHCMHLMLKYHSRQFTDFERKGLLIAAISHDLDHGGFTNNFLETTKDDLAFLYESSILENHHFYVAMLLLNKYKIFINFSTEDWDILIKEIQWAIISTDLHIYFSNRTWLKNICSSKAGFSWSDENHRNRLKGVMMTVCDLSGSCKPFLVSKRITDNLYAEFYKQGDIEKEMGLCPLSLMDRDRSHVIPEDQVSFMTIVLLPGLELLKKLLPSTVNLYNEATLLTNTWQEIIDIRDKKVWRQDDSIVEKRYNY